MKWQQRFSTPEHKRQYVRALFETIAHRYDVITVVLSGGLDRRWKKRLLLRARPLAGRQVLDLASGTGDIALQAAAEGADVVALDITGRMLELARQKAGHGSRPGHVTFVTADMTSLPFGDAMFDVITTGYGLRNVPDLQASLREMARVLRPGGRMLSLDFDRPANPAVRAAYLGYLTVTGSALGFVLHRDPDTYRYIPESIRRYPGARAVSDLAIASGFRSCSHEPLLGGLMAMHTALK